MTTKLVLSSADIAEILGVSRRTVNRYAAAGRLPKPIKHLPRRRWRRADIEKWVEEGCPVRRRLRT